MIRGLTDLALVGYIWGAALALLAIRRGAAGVSIPARPVVLVAWGIHTLAVVVQTGFEGQLPLRSLHEALSTMVWVVVAFYLWMERRYRMRVLGAFVLPVAGLLGLLAASMPGSMAFRPSGAGWIWVHAMFQILGFAAFVFNFSAGLMYLLQERQLKSKRPGPFSHRLPSLEILDRVSFQALVIGFPFLTLGLILGTISAGIIWGSYWRWEPVQVISFATWSLYAGTLYVRLVQGWRGRKAAYFAIAGFILFVLTVGVGLVLPTRHVRL